MTVVLCQMDEHETALVKRRLRQYGPAEMAVFFPERSSSLICFCPIPFYAHESVINATEVALAESGATLAFRIGSLVWWRGRAITEFTTLERGWWVYP